MKKLRVIHEFFDKYNRSLRYGVGTVVVFEDARAENVVSLGLAEEVVSPASVAPAKSEPEPEPVAETVVPAEPEPQPATEQPEPEPVAKPERKKRK